MTVAYDAFSSQQTPQTVDFNFTHTPVGTPKAIIVWVIENGANTDRINGVTYGGVAMTEVSGSPNVKSSGSERGAVHCFFLGSSIPTGAQSVAVDMISSVSGTIAYCVSLTASADTEIIDSDGTINSNNTSDPSVTLSLSGGTCFCAIGFFSGQDAVTSITPLTNWTARAETDFGSQTAGCYTYNTIGTADVTAGWTQTGDDAAAIAVAISEIVTGGTPVECTVTGKETRNKIITHV